MKLSRSGYARHWGWTDLWIALALLAIALLVRLVYARAVVFPPLDDPAFYLTTAKNLVTGHGLEVDALWSYQTLFPSVTHPSHEHWMPLTTGIIAAAFALLKPSLEVGQLPGLILGALLAPLTYIVGRRDLPGSVKPVLHVSSTGKADWSEGNRWISLGAGLLIAINATLNYQSASADSSAPFALLAAWALASTVQRIGKQGGYFGVGLVIGLAYLTRADGFLLLLAVFPAWLKLPGPARFLAKLPDKPAAQVVQNDWRRERGSEQDWRHTVDPRFAGLLEMGLAFVLVVVPWLVRDYLAFGTPLPGSLLSQAWLTDYVDTFNYWSHPNWETLLAQGWPALLAQRSQALLHDGRVFLLSTFPWGVLSLPGLWLLRRAGSFFSSSVYGLLLFFVLAIAFPVASMSGTFYHSLGAVMPFLALAAMFVARQGIHRLTSNRKLATTIFSAVTAGLLVLAGAQVTTALPAVAARHLTEKEQFEAVAGWLAEHSALGDVVMTSQPYTLNYASGHPCIVLPGNEPPDAAWEAAQRYGARFLVITQTFGHYPQILHDQPDPRFRLLEGTGTTEIYAIGEKQP
jgi:hypothetical protein